MLFLWLLGKGSQTGFLTSIPSMLCLYASAAKHCTSSGTETAQARTSWPGEKAVPPCRVPTAQVGNCGKAPGMEVGLP